MEFINNRQVNLWRGSNEPPTKYHVWIKDNKLLLYNGEQWSIFVDSFDSLEDLKQAVAKIENSTVNGKLIKNNPVLTSLDILIGKDLKEFKSSDSIIKVLEALDESYHEGYPIKVTSDLQGVVTVSIGDSEFKIQTTGESLNLRTRDNLIVLDSTALTSVPAEAPLTWTSDRKLVHNDSGVQSGSYGEASDREHAETVIVPHIEVDSKGHITSISDTQISVRDYVQQIKPSDSNKNAVPVLLAYDTKEQANPVRQAHGLTYNDSTGELATKGNLKVGGGVNVIGGDIVLAPGYKIYGELYGNITGTAIPKVHTSQTPNYGSASTALYGHVKLQDDLGTEAPLPSSTNEVPDKDKLEEGVQAVAASPLMVWNALQESKKFTKEYFSDDFEEKDNKIYLRWEEIK